MRDPHGRVRHVDVLPTGARRPIGVDPQILGVDLDVLLAVLGKQRDDVKAGEAGVAPVGLVERGQAHQSVDAAFGGEQSVRVRPLERERGALDAGLLAGQHLIELGVQPLALGPSEVHAEKHVRPIL